MVHSHLMPRILHSSSIILLVKLVPLSFKEPGRGSKDRDVASIQKFSNSFCSLIRGHICYYMFCELVLENQDVGDSRQLVQLQHGLNTCEIYI